MVSKKNPATVRDSFASQKGPLSPQKGKVTKAASSGPSPAKHPVTPAKQVGTKPRESSPPPTPIHGGDLDYLHKAQDLSETEHTLRNFDLTSKFGPVVGMSRLERWNRAEKLGLNPPREVFDLIQRQGGAGSEAVKNLWHGRPY